MVFDWTHAEQPAEAQTEKLPAGWHHVRVARIVTHRSTGEPFTSRKGDPQVMIVFADDHDREATQMFLEQADELLYNPKVQSLSGRA